MTELSDYKRMIERPMLEAKNRRIRELATALEAAQRENNRASDAGYLLGLRAGWNMGVMGEIDNFNKAVAGYETQLGIRRDEQLCQEAK